MYESKISDAKWIAYDIPGNVGWIAFLVGLILCFSKRPEVLESKLIFCLLLLDLLCGVLMLVGIGELVSERLQKLDRVLPKKRLYRGFGALTSAVWIFGLNHAEYVLLHPANLAERMPAFLSEGGDLSEI